MTENTFEKARQFYDNHKHLSGKDFRTELLKLSKEEIFDYSQVISDDIIAGWSSALHKSDVRAKSLQSKVEELEAELSSIKVVGEETPKLEGNYVPAICPVCQGRKFVPWGFYLQHGTTTSLTGTTECCQSCNGTGILLPKNFLPEQRSLTAEESNALYKAFLKSLSKKSKRKLTVPTPPLQVEITKEEILEKKQVRAIIDEFKERLLLEVFNVEGQAGDKFNVVEWSDIEQNYDDLIDRYFAS